MYLTLSSYIIMKRFFRESAMRHLSVDYNWQSRLYALPIAYIQYVYLTRYDSHFDFWNALKFYYKKNTFSWILLDAPLLYSWVLFFLSFNLNQHIQYTYRYSVVTVKCLLLFHLHLVLFMVFIINNFYASVK